MAQNGTSHVVAKCGLRSYQIDAKKKRDNITSLLINCLALYSSPCCDEDGLIACMNRNALQTGRNNYMRHCARTSFAGCQRLRGICCHGDWYLLLISVGFRKELGAVRTRKSVLFCFYSLSVIKYFVQSRALKIG